MIWFSADYHLSHKNIIKYCNRPFEDVNEMDRTILKNLRAKVQDGDILYFLGDLSFKVNVVEEFFKTFSDIEIHYIVGNHDNNKVIKLARNYCASVSALKDIYVKHQPITLCHYAMRVWNKSHFNSWQLYGHSHSTLAPLGKQHDVGVDNHNFFPISFEELTKIMMEKPNNFNFIPPEKRDR